MVLPFDKVGEIILSHDDLELLVRMPFAQMNKGVDSIAGFRQVKFNIGSFNLIMIVHCRPHHIVAVEFMEQTFAGLEWILWRDYHPDLLKVSSLRHDVGYDQVADMNRIERAEEETNFQGVYVF